MIALKSAREIELMTEAGAILKQVFEAVEPKVQVGVTTIELDRVAEKIIRDAGAEPAFKGYRGFPGTACISINEEVVHGIPGERVLKDGDLISFDIGSKVKGYFADSARTWIVGDTTDEIKRLVATAKDSFEAGLRTYKEGSRLGDMSAAIQSLIESRGYQVVRDYVGHGIGRAIHEEPQVPNYGNAGQGIKLKPGLVLAIEPMVTEGHYGVEMLADGWTVVTKDRKLSSHYEDTVVFTEKGVYSLTSDFTTL